VLSVLRRERQRDSLLQFVRVTTAVPFSYTLVLFPDAQHQWQLGVLNEQQPTAAWQLAVPTAELNATVTLSAATVATILAGIDRSLPEYKPGHGDGQYCNGRMEHSSPI